MDSKCLLGLTRMTRILDLFSQKTKYLHYLDIFSTMKKKKRATYLV